MKSLKYFLGCILVTFIVASCSDSDFEELNTNPNSPVVVPSSNLLTDAIRISANSLYSTGNGGDMGSCWSQQWAKVQYNDEARYSPRQTSISGIWDTFYEILISDAKTAQDLAVGEENVAVQGAALTLQAYGYAHLTDLFGNIPVTQAMRADEGIFAPEYDAQSVVYDSIFAMLDRADALLASGSGAINPSFDILYAGDASKWRKFANSLKFRVAMRMSGVREAEAGTILAGLMSRPMFTSSDDEAKLVYLEAQPNANPMYESIVFGAREEYKVSDVLVSTLEGLGDPRLSVYVAPNSEGVFRGKPAGIQDVPSDLYNYENVSGIGAFYLRPEAPAYFVSYGELLLLMAEAADRGLISASAADLYNAGVAESMAASGVSSGVDAYIAANPFSSESIQLQKWLTLFSQGMESWTEWRRTGIPNLTPAIDANPAVGEIPSRLTYPATEQTTNIANYLDAVAAQGPDLLTTKIGWMQ
jgi:hypothetical protein